MYTTIFVHKHPGERFDEQVTELKERIVPLVKSQPGFLSGTWSFDTLAGRSYSHLVWESEESAQRFFSFLKAQATQSNPFGIVLDSAHLNVVLTEV
jgi:hypothetical protein